MRATSSCRAAEPRPRSGPGLWLPVRPRDRGHGATATDARSTQPSRWRSAGKPGCRRSRPAMDGEAPASVRCRPPSARGRGRGAGWHGREPLAPSGRCNRVETVRPDREARATRARSPGRGIDRDASRPGTRPRSPRPGPACFDRGRRRSCPRRRPAGRRHAGRSRGTGPGRPSAGRGSRNCDDPAGVGSGFEPVDGGSGLPVVMEVGPEQGRRPSVAGEKSGMEADRAPRRAREQGRGEQPGEARHAEQIGMQRTQPRGDVGGSAGPH
jgi:hypothetical protein